MTEAASITKFNNESPENRLEKYWVASTGDVPEKMYFSRKDAFASESLYLDSFCETGERVEGYKMVSDDDENIGFLYTTDF